MAKKVTVTMVDDTDDTKTADETIEFGLDGVTYEIDLHKTNSDKFHKDMAKWVEHARRVGGRKKTGRTPGASAPGKIDREQTQAIREWAEKNGFKVSARGRISQEVMDAYSNQHKTPEFTS